MNYTGTNCTHIGENLNCKICHPMTQPTKNKINIGIHNPFDCQGDNDLCGYCESIMNETQPTWGDRLRDEWEKFSTTPYMMGNNYSGWKVEVLKWWLDKITTLLTEKDAEIELLKSQELGKSLDCAKHEAEAYARGRREMAEEVRVWAENDESINNGFNMDGYVNFESLLARLSAIEKNNEK
jgi:hypothetical protein